MSEAQDAGNGETAAWLRRQAIPIECGTATDLAALGGPLRGVKIVGMGEVTHGTREFFRLKLRLLRHLVTELGFNVLAIEAGHSAAQAVNDHVVNGRGDRSAVLTGLGSVMWDVEEFAEALDWLRAHNDSAADARKVRFYGLDIWNTEVGRERVLAYVRSVAPREAPSVEELFQAVALGESKGMLVAHRHLDREMYRRVRDLSDFFASNRTRFAGATSAADHRDAAYHVEVIRQWLGANTGADESLDFLPAGKGLNNLARSVYMARNLRHLVERAGADAKVVVWAHAYHLGVGLHDDVHGVVPNMGRLLRDRFGHRYYVFCMELGGGEYLARALLPDRTLGDLTTGTVPPPPDGSLPWQLSKAGGAGFVVDLRTAERSSRVGEWLAEKRVTHSISWLFGGHIGIYTRAVPAVAYDGVVFVAATSPTTPTPGALRAVRERTGH